MPCHGEYIGLRPLQCTRCTETKKYGPNERADQNSKTIQLSDEEITNLSHAQLKALVTRIVTELVEYSQKVEEKTKAMKSQIQENIQENQQ